MSCVETPTRRLHVCSQRCSGMTLIELLLAMAATGFVGLAIASMFQAVSYGTGSAQDMRELVVGAHVVDSRLTAAIRESHAVLAAGDDYLVLWKYDSDGDGLPGLHELQRIDHDAPAHQLVAFTADADAPDIIYTLDGNFASITENLIDDDTLTRQLWADAAAELTFTLDTQDISDARLISYRLTLAAGTLQHVVANAVALRN